MGGFRVRKTGDAKLIRPDRWHCYMGRFRVPDWLFHYAPMWMHRFADKLGGVK